MKCTFFIVSVLIILVNKSDEFLLKTFQNNKCFSDNESNSNQQTIEFHEILKEKCENMMKDKNFTRSVHFAKFIGFPYDTSSVLISTQGDITRIAHQYRESNASNVSNKSVESSEEMNLQHFLKYFYDSYGLLSERTNFNKFSNFTGAVDHDDIVQNKISEYTNHFSELRALDISHNSLKNFDYQLNLKNLWILNASHNQLSAIPSSLSKIVQMCDTLIYHLIKYDIFMLKHFRN